MSFLISWHTLNLKDSGLDPRPQIALVYDHPIPSSTGISSFLIILPAASSDSWLSAEAMKFLLSESNIPRTDLA